jgi:hypothetical protein
VQEAEQGIDEANEVEIFPEEGGDEPDEIQSSICISEKTAKLMVQAAWHNLFHNTPCLKSE